MLHEISELDITTAHLLSIAVKGNVEVFLSDANLYMELFGLICVAWQWLSQATVAQKGLAENNASTDDTLFYRSKIETMQFFFHYELRKTKALHERLRDTKVLTVFKKDEVLM